MNDASALAKPDRFGQLLNTLNQSELEMTSYELADMCWLLLHAPQIAEQTEKKSKKPKPRREKIKKTDHVARTPLKENVPGKTPEPPPSSKIQEPSEGKLYPEQPKKQYSGKSIEFSVDNPSDLGSSLTMARALKALLRRVPALARPEVLDEIATVENYAAINVDSNTTTNKKILAPIFKPALEPWLELALVIDGNFSMDIWHQTIADLIIFLRNYGIFRNVRVWKLACQQDQDKLTLHTGLNLAKSRIASPKELLNPDGRRIIICVSDCVADYWHNGKILDLIEQWQKINPVAILQMLPEWLWLKTGLGEGAKVTLISNQPGVRNSQLRLKDILLWEDVFNDPSLLKIPVFTLEPKSIERWSGMVAGLSNIKVAGFVLASPDLEQELESESSQQDEFESEAEPDLTPAAIVRRFRNNSSLLAQELTELLAAAPTIFLPVVRLIRRELLPEAGQVQIAEVFLGGILRVRSDYPQGTHPDLILYDFIAPQVRKIFQRSSARSVTVDVFDRVSKYIAAQLGIELRAFLAELRKPPEEVEKEFQDVIHPFAEVSVEILETLGGDYARFAREELKAAGDIRKDKPKYDFNRFPPLQDLEYQPAKIVLLKGIELLNQQFEVAEVVIEQEEYETFEFVTAKLELKPKGLLQRLNPLSRDNNEWEINRQTRQGKQLIEQLSEEVELEMVLIPPGEFMMGAASGEINSSSNEKPQHKVKIEYSFLMGKYPITQAQWRVIAALPQVNRELKADPSIFKGDKRPIEKVSWYDALEFCQRLSKQTGRDYSLPSEAEWEYACRAKTTTPFNFGETITTDLANYNGDYTYGQGVQGVYRRKTTPVDKFGIANDFGLCDMHGNVWEWCEDYWQDNYQNAPTDGSSWTSGDNSSFRVLRGGSWSFTPWNCRSATRDDDHLISVNASYSVGFRVVCRVP